MTIDQGHLRSHVTSKVSLIFFKKTCFKVTYSDLDPIFSLIMIVLLRECFWKKNFLFFVIIVLEIAFFQFFFILLYSAIEIFFEFFSKCSWGINLRIILIYKLCVYDVIEMVKCSSVCFGKFSRNVYRIFFPKIQKFFFSELVQ